MNLYYLRYFVKLAHVQHYTRAAEQLCITQPSLSHAIAQLEKELGVPLFERTGRKTTLTRFGEEFLPCAEHTLASLDAGVSSLQKAARGGPASSAGGGCMCKAAGFAAISHDLFFGKLRTPAGGGTDFCGNGNQACSRL